MVNKYKYDPSDFEGMMFLSEDMAAFYTECELFIKDRDKDKTERDRFIAGFNFEKSLKELFLSIKHRAVEGFLSPSMVSELEDYMIDLFDEAVGERGLYDQF